MQTEDPFTCWVCGQKYVYREDDNPEVWRTSNYTNMSLMKSTLYRLLSSNPWGIPSLDWANPYRPGVNESRTADSVAKPTSFVNIVFSFAQPWSKLILIIPILLNWSGQGLNGSQLLPNGCWVVQICPCWSKLV